MDRDKRDTAWLLSTLSARRDNPDPVTWTRSADELHPTFVGPFLDHVGMEPEDALGFVHHLCAPETSSVAHLVDPKDPKISVLISGISETDTQTFTVTALLSDASIATLEDKQRALRDIEQKAAKAGCNTLQAAFYADQASEADEIFKGYDLSTVPNVDITYAVFKRQLHLLTD